MFYLLVMLAMFAQIDAQIDEDTEGVAVPPACATAAIDCSTEMVTSQLYAEMNNIQVEQLPGWNEAVAYRNRATQLALKSHFAEATEKFIIAATLFKTARGADD